MHSFKKITKTLAWKKKKKKEHRLLFTCKSRGLTSIKSLRTGKARLTADIWGSRWSSRCCSVPFCCTWTDTPSTSRIETRSPRGMSRSVRLACWEKPSHYSRLWDNSHRRGVVSFLNFELTSIGATISPLQCKLLPVKFNNTSWRLIGLSGDPWCWEDKRITITVKARKPSKTTLRRFPVCPLDVSKPTTWQAKECHLKLQNSLFPPGVTCYFKRWRGRFLKGFCKQARILHLLVFISSSATCCRRAANHSNWAAREPKACAHV